MIAYYETDTKRFISYNPYTKWDVQGEPSSDMKKAILDFYHGLCESARGTDTAELADGNLIIKVERTEDKENKAFDYVITTYLQVGKTEYTIMQEGDTKCPEETT